MDKLIGSIFVPINVHIPAMSCDCCNKKLERLYYITSFKNIVYVESIFNKRIDRICHNCFNEFNYDTVKFLFKFNLGLT